MSKSSSYRSSKPNYMTGSTHEQEQQQEPFFSPESDSSFFQPKLSIGQPNDKFEKEADNVADKVVSKKEMDKEPAIQRQEISSIQRLATPQEDENFATNDERMKRDRELREKPEIQQKCAHCEEEEAHGVQKKEEREDPGSMVQRKGDSPGVASESITSRIDSSRGNGSTLPGSTLHEMQSSFGHDLSKVNIHTDAESVQMNRELGAQAFTHGNDIYFNTGKFDPASSTGKHLLAHELTHVVQQGAAGPVSNGHAGIQRSPAPSNLQNIKNQVQQLGLDLEDGDLQYLQQTYPGGIMIFPHQMVISMLGTNENTVLKYPGFIVSPVSTPESTVDTFIFKVGKGRSILVSSQAGASILLDAGSGNSKTSGSQGARKLAEAVNNVIGSGLAPAPSSIKISHLDIDHYNAVDDLLRLPALSAATVEVTRQQLQEGTRLAGKGWNRMSIRFNPTQGLIELDIVGDNRSVNRAIIGEMEIIDYRSVAAHAALGTSTFNKNNTSPVTVVRDLNTNSTMVFTADGDGRLLIDAVDMMGGAASQRIMGGGGRNLSHVEVSHHTGEVKAGPVAVAMVRFYRAAFESSKGDLKLFSQTSANFSARDSSSLRFLRSVGILIDTIQNDPSTTPGTSEVRKATGSTMQDITIDNGAVQQVRNLASQAEPDLNRAYAARSGILELLEKAQALEQAFAAAGEAKLSGPLAVTRASLERLLTQLDTDRGVYWTAMETTADTYGMRGSTDTTAIQAALRTLLATAERVTTSSANDGQMLDGIISDLSTRLRLLRNMFEIGDAVEKGDIGRLETAKAEQTRLLRVARANLGKTIYNEIFKAVWQEVSEKYMTGLENFAENTSRIEAMRRIRADRRMVLDDSLSRQIDLNEIAEAASQGTLPGKSPGAPVGTKIGGYAMLAIQVGSMAMDIMESVKHTNAVNERFKKVEKAKGNYDLIWWQSRGVIPTIALVNYKEGWEDKYVEIVSGDEAYTALSSGKGPDYDKIVIKDVKESDQYAVILHFYNEFTTMEEWVEKMGNPDSTRTGWIARRDGVWAAKRWSSDDAQYVYHALPEKMQTAMKKLFAQLEEAESDKLTRESATEVTGSIKNSAYLFGTDRYAYVYGKTGHIERIDLDDLLPNDTLPEIAIVGRDTVADYGEMQIVRAIDLPTYNVLSRYYWTSKGGESEDDQGYHTKINVDPNTEGKAYVREKNLKNVMPPAKLKK